MRWWTLLFGLLTAALSVALILEARENHRLRDLLDRQAAHQARARGLAEGRALEPFTLRDAAGDEVRVDFAGDLSGSLLLFHARSCGACESSVAFWREALARANRPDVRVLCIQTDAAEGALHDLQGLPSSLAVPLPPTGWLAALPAVPATLVVDGYGVLTRAWYSEIDAGGAHELAGVLASLQPR